MISVDVSSVMQTAQPSGSSGSSPGLAVLILGGVVVIGVSAGFLLAARVAQRRYFQAYEQARSIRVYDPHVWEMRVSDVFTSRDSYWRAMLESPPEPELRLLRRMMLFRVGVGIGVLLCGMVLVLGLASLVGFG